jgi:hypothetical protein
LNLTKKQLKATQSNKGEGGMAREPKWSTYWKNAEIVIEVVMVYWKNLVVVVGRGGNKAKSEHGSRGTWGFKDRDEDIVIEGQTRLSLPQPNGRVQ